MGTAGRQRDGHRSRAITSSQPSPHPSPAPCPATCSRRQSVTAAARLVTNDPFRPRATTSPSNRSPGRSLSCPATATTRVAGSAREQASSAPSVWLAGAKPRSASGTLTWRESVWRQGTRTRSPRSSAHRGHRRRTGIPAAPLGERPIAVGAASSAVDPASRPRQGPFGSARIEKEFTHAPHFSLGRDQHPRAAAVGQRRFRARSSCPTEAIPSPTRGSAQIKSGVALGDEGARTLDPAHILSGRPSRQLARQTHPAREAPHRQRSCRPVRRRGPHRPRWARRRHRLSRPRRLDVGEGRLTTSACSALRTASQAGPELSSPSGPRGRLRRTAWLLVRAIGTI